MMKKSTEIELRVLFREAIKAVSNLKTVFKDIKKKKLKGCNKCGCTIYPDKVHKC